MVYVHIFLYDCVFVCVLMYVRICVQEMGSINVICNGSTKWYLLHLQIKHSRTGILHILHTNKAHRYIYLEKTMDEPLAMSKKKEHIEYYVYCTMYM